MTILDNSVRMFLQAITEDPDMMEQKPEYVQAARELLDTDYMELEERANYFLGKCKGGGNA